MLLNITNLPTKRKDLNDVFLTQSVRLARGGAPKPPKRRRKTAKARGFVQSGFEEGGRGRQGGEVENKPAEAAFRRWGVVT